MPPGITQCYLPPCSGEFPAFTPAGTRFSHPEIRQVSTFCSRTLLLTKILQTVDFNLTAESIASVHGPLITTIVDGTTDSWFLPLRIFHMRGSLLSNNRTSSPVRTWIYTLVMVRLLVVQDRSMKIMIIAADVKWWRHLPNDFKLTSVNGIRLLWSTISSNSLLCPCMRPRLYRRLTQLFNLDTFYIFLIHVKCFSLRHSIFGVNVQ